MALGYFLQGLLIRIMTFSGHVKVEKWQLEPKRNCYQQGTACSYPALRITPGVVMLRTGRTGVSRCTLVRIYTLRDHLSDWFKTAYAEEDTEAGHKEQNPLRARRQRREGRPGTRLHN